ncbi:hypothetical protein [Hymenobacter sp. AT01-02]|uniref:hypothetical protein n=1 Tax=Hymenobacter sp. AT01-02 TaxID=1571877 RepID=UPI0006E403AC|nr:hypothetical protein [Hymenobacter sp. AT01-02]
MRVSIETTQGWQLVEQIQTVGPLASRDLVVPFTVPGTTSSGPIRLKLETGFMFWEVDYAAVDFSADAPVHIEKLTPHSARDEQGRDQRTALATTDSHYLAQTHPGTEVALRYRTASTPTPDHMVLLLSCIRVATTSTSATTKAYPT